MTRSRERETAISVDLKACGVDDETSPTQETTFELPPAQNFTPTKDDEPTAEGDEYETQQMLDSARALADTIQRNDILNGIAIDGSKLTPDQHEQALEMLALSISPEERRQLEYWRNGYRDERSPDELEYPSVITQPDDGSLGELNLDDLDDWLDAALDAGSDSRL